MTTKSDVLRLKAEVDAMETRLTELLEANGHSAKDPVVVMALLVMVQTSLAYGALRVGRERKFLTLVKKETGKES